MARRTALCDFHGFSAKPRIQSITEPARTEDLRRNLENPLFQESDRTTTPPAAIPPNKTRNPRNLHIDMPVHSSFPFKYEIERETNPTKDTVASFFDSEVTLIDLKSPDYTSKFEAHTSTASLPKHQMNVEDGAENGSAMNIYPSETSVNKKKKNATTTYVDPSHTCFVCERSFDVQVTTIDYIKIRRELLATRIMLALHIIFFMAIILLTDPEILVEAKENFDEMREKIVDIVQWFGSESVSIVHFFAKILANGFTKGTQMAYHGEI